MLKQQACKSSDKFSMKDTQRGGDACVCVCLCVCVPMCVFMKWQTLTVTGSAHKSPCKRNERVFAGCENILQHAPLQTLLLINLSALCFESNLVQPPEKHSAVSGAWLCFEGRGLLPSQSTARLRCKNTSSRCSTLAFGYTPHTQQCWTGLNRSWTKFCHQNWAIFTHKLWTCRLLPFHACTTQTCAWKYSH